LASPGHNARSHSNRPCLICRSCSYHRRTVANDSASYSSVVCPSNDSFTHLHHHHHIPLAVQASSCCCCKTSRCRAPLPLAEPNFPSFSPRLTTTTTTTTTSHPAETHRPPANSLVLPTRTHCDIRCRRHMVFQAIVSPCSLPLSHRTPGTSHAPTSSLHLHHHRPLLVESIACHQVLTHARQ